MVLKGFPVYSFISATAIQQIVHLHQINWLYSFKQILFLVMVRALGNLDVSPEKMVCISILKDENTLAA